METIKERLLKEYESAIMAIYGNRADDPYKHKDDIDANDLFAINCKVRFYLDL